MRAFLDGWRRALRAPALTFLMFGVIVFLALLSSAVQTGTLGASGGALHTFVLNAGDEAPAIYGGEFTRFGWTLPILGDPLFRDATGDAGIFVAITAALLWLFLSGGVVDRLARDRRVGVAHFLAVTGVFFLRFLRLAVVAGGVFWILICWTLPRLDATNDVLWLSFITGLVLIGAVADFAMIRAVVEDRRSMIGAIGAGLRFLRRRVVSVAWLLLLNAATFSLVLAIVWRASFNLASGPGLLLFAVSLLLAVWARLALLGSEIAFFQQALAHARYTAMPPTTWPDSPAAEAINNLRDERPRESFLGE